MKKLLEEFKAFAVKGNVVDLATAVIIGGAFGKIVSSLVADIIMPLVGLITGGNFGAWKIILRPEAINEINGVIVKTALILNAGNFVQQIVDFLLIAGSVFLMIKLLITVKQKFSATEEKTALEPLPPVPADDIKLLTEIRDLLKNKTA